MQDWRGLLLNRPERMGMVKVGYAFAGLARTIVDEAR